MSFGSIEAIGDPIEGGSWSQTFGLYNQFPPAALVDYLGVQMISADDFESPVFRNFNDWDNPGEWSNVVLPNPAKQGAATGPQLQYMQFSINFTGNVNPVQFDFVEFLGCETTQVTRVTRTDGGNWTYQARDKTSYSKGDFVVPEPASIAIWSLIGLGFVGLRAWRRRSRA